MERLSFGSRDVPFLGQNEGVHLGILDLAVECEFESIFQQRLEHLPILIAADLAGRFGDNIESLVSGVNPALATGRSGGSETPFEESEFKSAVAVSPPGVRTN